MLPGKPPVLAFEKERWDTTLSPTGRRRGEGNCVSGKFVFGRD